MQGADVLVADDADRPAGGQRPQTLIGLEQVETDLDRVTALA